MSAKSSIILAVCAIALLAGGRPPDATDGRQIVESGRTISNKNGSCLVMTGLKDAIIENLLIGPCGDHGIELHDSRRVLIRNVTIKDTVGSGIYVFGSQSIDVIENTIGNAVTGVYAEQSTGVRVSCNTIENVRGPIPRGQFVQFNGIEGPYNKISCNFGRNGPGGDRRPEDGINVFASSGTSQSPIEVAHNLLVGGGPSESGGGIMLGDYGGSYQVARANTLVDPGQYGIGIASGNHIQVLNNDIFARKQPFTNVGIYVWNQYPSACRLHKVSGNRVKWTSKTGRLNGWWNGRNCGTVKGIATNDFTAPLGADIARKKAPECKCSSAGRS